MESATSPPSRRPAAIPPARISRRRSAPPMAVRRTVWWRRAAPERTPPRNPASGLPSGGAHTRQEAADFAAEGAGLGGKLADRLQQLVSDNSALSGGLVHPADTDRDFLGTMGR